MDKNFQGDVAFKNNKTKFYRSPLFWIMLVVIVALVLMLAILLIEQNKNNSGSAKDAVSSKDAELPIEELPNPELLGKSLFSTYVIDSDYGENIEYFLLGSGVKTFENLTTKEIFRFVMLNIPASELNFYTVTYKPNGSCDNDTYNFGDLDLSVCAHTSLPVSLFNEYFVKLFGDDKTVDLSGIDGYEYISPEKGVSVCAVEGEEIRCANYGDIGGAGFPRRIAEFDHVEYSEDGNNFYVYVNYLGFKHDANVANEYLLYNDYALENMVGDGSYDAGLTDAEMFDVYSEQAGQFKLTFAQNADGEWHWVQSEEL